jgi:hypothetical protein
MMMAIVGAEAGAMALRCLARGMPPTTDHVHRASPANTLSYRLHDCLHGSTCQHEPVSTMNDFKPEAGAAGYTLSACVVLCGAGGVYIAGGITPRVLPRLRSSSSGGGSLLEGFLCRQVGQGAMGGAGGCRGSGCC